MLEIALLWQTCIKLLNSISVSGLNILQSWSGITVSTANGRIGSFASFLFQRTIISNIKQYLERTQKHVNFRLTFLLITATRAEVTKATSIRHKTIYTFCNFAKYKGTFCVFISVHFSGYNKSQLLIILILVDIC